MLIDDDPIFLDVFSKKLNREGHRIVGFNKLQDAIEELLKVPDKYDAMLLDLKMPEISGLEWLRHIRLDGKHHPVAFVSGAADLNDAQNLVNQDLTAIFIKPFVMKTLKEVLLETGKRLSVKKFININQSLP